jgi:hypothetical protein
MVDFISIGDLVKYRIDRIQGEADACAITFRWRDPAI